MAANPSANTPAALLSVSSKRRIIGQCDTYLKTFVKDVSISVKQSEEIRGAAEEQLAKFQLIRDQLAAAEAEAEQYQKENQSLANNLKQTMSKIQTAQPLTVQYFRDMMTKFPPAYTQMALKEQIASFQNLDHIRGLSITQRRELYDDEAGQMCAQGQGQGPGPARPATMDELQVATSQIDVRDDSSQAMFRADMDTFKTLYGGQINALREELQTEKARSANFADQLSRLSDESKTKDNALASKAAGLGELKKKLAKSLSEEQRLQAELKLLEKQLDEKEIDLINAKLESAKDTAERLGELERKNNELRDEVWSLQAELGVENQAGEALGRQHEEALEGLQRRISSLTIDRDREKGMKEDLEAKETEWASTKVILDSVNKEFEETKAKLSQVVETVHQQRNKLQDLEEKYSDIDKCYDELDLEVVELRASCSSGREMIAARTKERDEAREEAQTLQVTIETALRAADDNETRSRGTIEQLEQDLKASRDANRTLTTRTEKAAREAEERQRQLEKDLAASKQKYDTFLVYHRQVDTKAQQQRLQLAHDLEVSRAKEEKLEIQNNMAEREMEIALLRPDSERLPVVQRQWDEVEVRLEGSRQRVGIRDESIATLQDQISQQNQYLNAQFSNLVRTHLGLSVEAKLWESFVQASYSPLSTISMLGYRQPWCIDRLWGAVHVGVDFSRLQWHELATLLHGTVLGGTWDSLEYLTVFLALLGRLRTQEEFQLPVLELVLEGIFDKLADSSEHSVLLFMAWLLTCTVNDRWPEVRWQKAMQTIERRWQGAHPSLACIFQHVRNGDFEAFCREKAAASELHRSGAWLLYEERSMVLVAPRELHFVILSDLSSKTISMIHKNRVKFERLKMRLRAPTGQEDIVLDAIGPDMAAWWTRAAFIQ